MGPSVLGRLAARAAIISGAARVPVGQGRLWPYGRRGATQSCNVREHWGQGRSRMWAAVATTGPVSAAASYHTGRWTHAGLEWCHSGAETRCCRFNRALFSVPPLSLSPSLPLFLSLSIHIWKPQTSVSSGLAVWGPLMCHRGSAVLLLLGLAPMEAWLFISSWSFSFGPPCEQTVDWMLVKVSLNSSMGNHLGMGGLWNVIKNDCTNNH